MIQRISSSSAILFICDIQETFRHRICSFPAILSTAKKLISACKILDIPILTTEQYPKAFGHTCVELDVRGHPIYEKSKFSMISSDQIKSHINEVDSILLTGIESHVCVLQTALDLRELKKQVFVVRDGISSMNKGEIEIAVERMRQAGCVITTSDSVLFEMVKDSKDTRFKAISGLIKEFKQQTADGLNSCL